jgi:hypothetical protein
MATASRAGHEFSAATTCGSCIAAIALCFIFSVILQ